VLLRALTPVRLESALGHEKSLLLIRSMAYGQTVSINDSAQKRQFQGGQTLVVDEGPSSSGHVADSDVPVCCSPPHWPARLAFPLRKVGQIMKPPPSRTSPRNRKECFCSRQNILPRQLESGQPDPTSDTTAAIPRDPKGKHFAGHTTPHLSPAPSLRTPRPSPLWHRCNTIAPPLHHSRCSYTSAT